MSGYTIGLGLFKGRYPILTEEGKLSPRGLGRFYLGRFLKLAPLYYAYCFFWELLCGNHFFVGHPKFLLQVLTFTFNGKKSADGIGHLWYISTAMQLYLLMPFGFLLIRLLKRRRATLIAFFAVLASGLALRLVLKNAEVDWYTRMYTFAPCNVDLVVCGMLLSYLKLNFAPTASKSGLMKELAALAMVVLVCYNVAIYYEGSTLSEDIYRYCLPTLYVLIPSLLILCFGDLTKRFARPALREALHNPLSLIDWFSGYTYVFYIFHIAVFMYVRDAFGSLYGFAALPLGVRVLSFYLLTFTLSLACAVIFSKIAQGAKKRK